MSEVLYEHGWPEPGSEFVRLTAVVARKPRFCNHCQVDDGTRKPDEQPRISKGDKYVVEAVSTGNGTWFSRRYCPECGTRRVELERTYVLGRESATGGQGGGGE